MNVSRRHAAALAALAALCAAAPATASDGHGPSSLPGAAIEHATPNSAVGQLTGGTAPAPAGGDAPAGGPSNGGAPAPSGCDYPAARQVFAPWHDQIAYVAAQNGGLEQGAAGWLLDGGAGVTEGNEPFALNASTDHQSLALPAGSSATSPVTCVTAGQPIFRFVARTSGDRHARLRVEVVYSTPRGNSVSLVVGKLRGGDAWAPTKRLAVRLGRARSHGVDTSSSIAFRFTPVGAGDWQVDDVMLDPRARS